MEINIKFKTDNAAFCHEDYRRGDPEEEADLNEEAKTEEVNRIVRCVSKDIQKGFTEGRIIDANGNHVGNWTMVDR